jgi:lipoprotein-releasing system permease protein
MVGVAMGTMALVVALSVFNGLEDLIRALYGTFDPEIKVTAAVGKTFQIDSTFINKIAAVDGVELVTEVIEDNALLKYREGLMVVKVKGVSENFTNQNRMDSVMVAGKLVLQEDGKDYAVIGRGVQYAMSISVDNQFFALQLWYPKNRKPTSLSPEAAFTRKGILPGGVFMIEKHYDEQYVFVPLSFAQELMSYEDERTALEIKTTPGSNISKVKNSIKALLGKEFLVLDSDEQHASLMKAIRIERLFIFVTFAFIICIASFNIFFSLSMLAIEKKRDIAILYAMGATRSIIRKIFLMEGVIIAFTGALFGLLLGLIICWLQQEFGLVSMGMDSSIIDAYPVKIEVMDFVFTGLLIVVITFIATFRPASRASSQGMKDVATL